MTEIRPSLDRLSDLSLELEEAFGGACFDGLPEDIAHAVNLAKAEMQAIPRALEDLNHAKRNFATLDHAIDRLLALSEEAADLADDDQRGREVRQKEFIRLARVVANVAGRQGYDQPGLSLMSKPQAKAAKMALRHLVPVKATLAQNLREQEANIRKAVEATREFFEIVKKTYPAAMAEELDFDLMSSSVEVPGLEPSRGQAFNCGLS